MYSHRPRKLRGIPLVTPFDFEPLIGRPPVYAVLYCLTLGAQLGEFRVCCWRVLISFFSKRKTMKSEKEGLAFFLTLLPFFLTLLFFLTLNLFLLTLGQKKGYQKFGTPFFWPFPFFLTHSPFFLTLPSLFFFDPRTHFFDPRTLFFWPRHPLFDPGTLFFDPRAFFWTLSP